jgi:hypothetical protein
MLQYIKAEHLKANVSNLIRIMNLELKLNRKLKRLFKNGIKLFIGSNIHALVFIFVMDLLAKLLEGSMGSRMSRLQ